MKKMKMKQWKNEKWEMKIHRRIIDISADDITIRQLMRLKIPDNVYIELSLT